MATDHIRYDLLVQDALRSVVRTVLEDAKDGLPGEHHFYISFDTTAEGVRLSPRMRAQYPKDMTIVLQHQFWGLKVEDDHFEVTLTFRKLPAELIIPFAALTGFVDPGVQFGLQFKVADSLAPHALPGETPAALAVEKPVEKAAEKPSAPGEVVSLDAFRKK